MTWLLRDKVTNLGLQQARSIRVRRSGLLKVLDQPVWLTVDGEGQDRVLSPGECLRLQRGHRLVIEPWQAHATSRLLWQPVAAGAGQRQSHIWRWWPLRLSAPAA